MRPAPLRILQISTAEFEGGAERIAWGLYNEYRARGHVSRLVVGRKRSTDPNVFEIPTDEEPNIWARLFWALHARFAPVQNTALGQEVRFWLDLFARGWTPLEARLGWERFHHPASRRMLALLPEIPDVVHAHNLHGDYFDLRILPRLSRQFPLFVTMHDSWLLSGHCAYSIDCNRWKSGCGKCPDLTLYPPVSRDATAFNFQRKRRIYERTHLYVAAPSRWLLEKLPSSMLAPGVVEARVIPNGIDLEVWNPGNREQARSALKIDRDEFVILAAGNHLRASPYKDFITLHEALIQTVRRCPEFPIVCLLLGDEAPEVRIGKSVIRPLLYERNPQVVARYYQAADVFAQASRADTFPNTVLEALACGTPVVATAVGGIPEQVEDGLTGFLTPSRDPQSMAERIEHLVRHPELRHQMRGIAATSASQKFNLSKNADTYLSWYYSVLERRGSRGTDTP